MTFEQQMKALKVKYSGQAVPQWEIDLLKPEAPVEEPKRRGRPSKAETTPEDNAG